MLPDVVILGGGLGGLSAAVRLAESGLRVTLVEHRPFLGGRTYSFLDPVTGDVVDNGQHLLLGCYHATRRYLRLIGSDHLAQLQGSLQLKFLRPGQPPSMLRCPPLPAPAHVFVGLLGLRSLSWADRARLFAVGRALLDLDADREHRLDAMTVTEWLTSLGQSPEARKVLWDVLAIGSLNDDPAKVSALLFFRVLRAAFLGRREHSSFLVPRAGLSPLLVDSARRFIESRNGRVLTGVRAAKLVHDGHALREVLCDDGQSLTAGTYVSAVPYYALSNLLGKSSPAPGLDLTRFRSSAIVSVNVWLDREVMTDQLAAMLDTTIHWVFNRSALVGSPGKRQHLCAVISGASQLVHLRNEEIVRRTIEDIAAVFPKAKGSVVERALVIKERRATFCPEPGLDRIRPAPQSSFANLFLAGDWTATGYPATIEGAIVSGELAAHAVLKKQSPPGGLQHSLRVDVDGERDGA